MSSESAPPSSEAEQESKTSSERVSEVEEPSEAEMAPPLPLKHLHLIICTPSREREVALLPISKTPPLPDVRVMSANVLPEKKCEPEVQDMSGEDARVKEEISDWDILKLPPLTDMSEFENE